MKILVLSDIHGRIAAIEKAISLIHNKGIGLAIITGDLTNFGEKKQAAEVLGMFKGMQVLAVPGNCDSTQVLEAMEEKNASLHGKARKIGRWTFAGFGGGIAGEPGVYLHTEEQIEKALEKLLTQKKEKTVLVTHVPPKGTGLDLTQRGMHVGSSAVRKAIEKNQPRLHLCGHIHEAFGEEKIGKTTSINIGALKEGQALLLELEDEITWKRIKA